MARMSQNLTDDGEVVLPWYRQRYEYLSRGLLFVYGEFGGGTAAFEVSPDSGTTWIAVADQTGVAVTFTVNGMIDYELFTDPENPLLYRVSLSGSTSPNLNVTVFDQR